MNKKRKKHGKSLLALLLVCVMAVAGISAYFTATDTATNTFEIGKISIDLQEPSWNGEVPTTPNQTVEKDPQILNDGNRDAYVYLSVEVPYANVVTANADGTKNAAADTELFSYTVKDGWVEVGTAEEDETKGVYRHVYAYAGDTSTLTALSPDATTPTLFDTISFANVVETPDDDGTLKDLLESTDLDVVINAYGIETEIIGGEATPDYVWEVITNQVIDAQEGNNGEAPVLLEGDGQVYSTFAVNDLRFRSSAAYGEFEEVVVNGEVVPEEYYSTSEGSTVVVLSGEYVANLEAGTNDIAVVSESGAATGTFSGEDVIPSGCTYTVKATGEVLTGGDELPDAPAEGDIYTTGDYEFHYREFLLSADGESQWFSLDDIMAGGVTSEQLLEDMGISQGPWFFTTIDKTKESYDTIPTTIFGENVTDMVGVFGGCTNMLYSPEVPSTVKYMCNTYEGCSSLKETPEIPKGVTTLWGTFSDCTSLETINIPKNVSKIGAYAFENCISLASITIPDSVTTIEQEAFSHCTGLTSITIPDSVKAVDEDAFIGCVLESLNYSGIAMGYPWGAAITSVPGMYGDTFMSWQELLDNGYFTVTDGVLTANSTHYSDVTGVLVVDDSVTEIGRMGSGLYTKGIKAYRIILPDTVTSISEVAFAYCKSLTDINIPDSVTTIKSYTFMNCTGLSSITIPDSVTNIASDTFEGCADLKTIYYSGTATGKPWGAPNATVVAE